MDIIKGYTMIDLAEFTEAWKALLSDGASETDALREVCGKINSLKCQAKNEIQLLKLDCLSSNAREAKYQTRIVQLEEDCRGITITNPSGNNVNGIDAPTWNASEVPAS